MDDTMFNKLVICIKCNDDFEHDLYNFANIYIFVFQSKCCFRFSKDSGLILKINSLS